MQETLNDAVQALSHSTNRCSINNSCVPVSGYILAVAAVGKPAVNHGSTCGSAEDAVSITTKKRISSSGGRSRCS